MNAGAQLSPALRRAAALGLLLGLVALLFFGLGEPLAAAFWRLEDENAASEAALERFAGAAARLPQLEAEAAALRQHLKSEAGFLPGGSDALAAAELQDRIKAMVAAGGGQLKSTQILPFADEGAFRRVAARVEWMGTIEMLRKLWWECETGTPACFVDAFEIRRRGMVDGPLSGMPGVIVDVRFDAHGYTRGPSR